MKLTTVTMSGIDETVNRYGLADIYDRYPFVEFGILRSKKRQGVEKRYPSQDWVHEAVCNMSVRFSFHLCGEWSRGHQPLSWALSHRHEFETAARIQLNIAALEPATIQVPWSAMDIFAEVGKPVVVQFKRMPTRPMPDVPSRSILLDASGGEGKLIADLPSSIPAGLRIGFAGGLDHKNVASVLEKIMAIPGDNEIWIDAESGLRDADNNFIIEKAELFVKAALPFVDAARKRPASSN